MKISAYGVHLLTATGAGLGLWSIILIYDGYFQEALWILAAAVLIDSIDGSLARITDVDTYAPAIDGALLDNIIDFITWTMAPLLWIYATMRIPLWVLLICAISSGFGFTNKRAKTPDNYFLGFPSYWNIVVFYVYMLNLPEMMAIAILLVFAAMTLLPIKFIYPSKTDSFKIPTLLLGTIFFGQLLVLLYLFNQAPPILIYSSFIFPVYYFGLSFYLNFKRATV